ncbi:calpain-5 [Nephila pilipes]|uniref:Calpain-5 n=1 Tax=Nephila pilipes TaxID=299642 RepID=A0A8X6QY54_NEPPI|nr:calpain-5 [Nephila pilipes]
MSEVIPVENRMVQFLTRTLQNSRAMSEVIPAENSVMQLLTRTLSNRSPFAPNLFSSACKPFKGQVYEDLKHQAQEAGRLFEDPEFPAADSSLSYSGNSQLPGPVQWKRPKEIHENPKLFVDGACSCDVIQGMLGNCWFVAACSSLAQEKELWNKVIPDSEEQEWSDETPENYAGIFHFRFWLFDGWYDVVIDDRLPTIDGQLIYIKSRDKNEFWGALLEKAYAKVAGSYESLDGGNLCDALIDFTGGIAETFQVQEEKYYEDEEKKVQLFRTMRSEIDNHSLLSCAISAASQEEMEARTEVGLVKGHAYGITAVKKVYIGETSLMSLFAQKEKIYMIRMRNPWGQKEWTGPFSDGSEEWEKISASERERIGLTFEEDGEFWMTFDDFCKYFTDLSICRLVNTSWFSFNKTWNEAIFPGKWITGPKNSETDRSGGCYNHKDTFLQNPQYRFDVEADDDTVMIFLMQRDRRALRCKGISHLVIGFHVMKVEANRRYRLHAIKPKAAGSEYAMSRNVFCRCNLKAGRYVIVPTTFDPNEEGEFLLRIFTSKANNGKEMVHDVPTQSMWPCISYPCLLTKVFLKGATGLEKQDRFGSADPYCIVKCEGERVRSPVCRETLNPEWNMTVLFYRKQADSLIKVQIWNSNVVMDTCLGKASVEAPLNPEAVTKEIELFGRLQEKGVKKPGVVTLEISTIDDLMGF